MVGRAGVLHQQLAVMRDFDKIVAVTGLNDCSWTAGLQRIVAVSGAPLAHDSVLTTASAEMKWLNGWSAAASFEGEFSDVSRSYAGKGMVRYAW